jgi:hypothetical protein
LEPDNNTSDSESILTIIPESNRYIIPAIDLNLDLWDILPPGEASASL